MSCAGFVAADGGTSVTTLAARRCQTGALQSRGWPDAVHRASLCIFPAGDACPFFSAFARSLGFPCESGISADEKVYRLRSDIALFEDPPGVRGSGWPSGGKLHGERAGWHRKRSRAHRQTRLPIHVHASVIPAGSLHDQPESHDRSLRLAAQRAGSSAPTIASSTSDGLCVGRTSHSSSVIITPMAKQYRALISIPITADNDDAARSQADKQAGEMRAPDGLSGSGHVEMVGEVPEGGLQIARVVHAEALFLRQLPPDWKP